MELRNFLILRGCEGIESDAFFLVVFPAKAGIVGIHSQALRAQLKMNLAFTTGYRRPRESGGPGATAAALPLLDSRFRGNDEKERQVVELSGFILGQALKEAAQRLSRRTHGADPRRQPVN